MRYLLILGFMLGYIAPAYAEPKTYIYVAFQPNNRGEVAFSGEEGAYVEMDDCVNYIKQHPKGRFFCGRTRLNPPTTTKGFVAIQAGENSPVTVNGVNCSNSSTPETPEQ